tara:strand:+ start:861 stop:1586 length:726 start_codon:yes stop_codon:yes gene_type:complete
MSILKSDNLKKVYESKTVIHDISLQVDSGEIVGLLGPNGAGKTTTFYMIVGLIKTDNGKIIMDDKDITHEPIHNRFKYGISYLPQEPSIFRDLSAKDNILSILEINNKINSKQNEKTLEYLIEKFDLKKFLNTKGVLLSGGERRRVEIARAIALRPKFLLLDEPFAGIDPLSVIDIQEIISELAQEDIGILITDHNVRETLKICDRSYVINSGKVLASGKAKELVKNEIVKKVYLGESFKL